MLDFNGPTKLLFKLQLPVVEGSKTNFRRKRKLIAGPRNEKMKVAS